MAKTDKAIAKIKKKRWVTVVAPKYMNEMFLGESYVAEPQTLVDRKITINLMTITNDMKKQNIDMRFKIDKVTGDKAFTSFDAYTMVPSSIRRLIRRGRNRIDYTLFLTSKDGVNLKINMLMITGGAACNSILTKARHAVYMNMSKTLEGMALPDFVKTVVSGKLSEELRARLKPIYPIRICEVRTINIVHEKHHSLLKKTGQLVEEAPEETVEEAVEEAAEEAVVEAEEQQVEVAEAEEAVAEEAKEEAKPKKSRKKKAEAAEEETE